MHRHERLMDCFWHPTMYTSLASVAACQCEARSWPRRLRPEGRRTGSL